MNSRIELDRVDRASVESVRRRLAEMDERGVGDLDMGGLLSMVGRLQALVDALLAVIDGPARDEGADS